MVSQEFDKYCTVTIQGGGIYALSSLGQMKAIEELNIKPVAYGGTSAGAIVATLLWAGYSSEEIRDEFIKITADESLLTLFGPFEPVSSGRFLDLKAFADLIESAKVLRQDLDFLSRVRRPFVHLSGGRAPVGGRISKFWNPEKTPRGKLRKTTIGAARLLKTGFEFLGSHYLILYRLYMNFRNTNGIFSAENFENKISEMLLKKLREYRPDSEFDDQYKPRFSDFQNLPEICPVRPALFLSVTNVKFQEAEFVNSIATAYADLEIAKVVMASAAVPVFIQPRELEVWRDRSARNKPATRGTIERELERLRLGRPDQQSPILHGDKSHFVDGGVVANFPIWAMLRAFREVMYGLDPKPISDERVESGVRREQIRLRPGESFSDLKIFDYPTHAPSELSALAWRPMVHFGLRIMPRHAFNGSGKSERERTTDTATPGRFLNAMVGFMTGGTRSHLEELLVNVSSPGIVTIEQPLETSGLPQDSKASFLEFGKLDPKMIREVFATSLAFSRERVSRVNFTFPDNEEVTSILDGIVQVASQQLSLLCDYNMARPVAPRSSVFVAVGDRLNLSYHSGMEGDPDRNLSLHLHEGVSGFCFATRQPVIADLSEARKNENFRLEDSREAKVSSRMNLVISCPIADYSSSDARPVQVFDAKEIQDDFVEKPESGVLAFGPPVRGPIFGVLSVDAEIDWSRVEGVCLGADQTSMQALLQLVAIRAETIGQLFGHRLGGPLPRGAEYSAGARVS